MFEIDEMPDEVDRQLIQEGDAKMKEVGSSKRAYIRMMKKKWPFGVVPYVISPERGIFQSLQQFFYSVVAKNHLSKISS